MGRLSITKRRIYDLGRRGASASLVAAHFGLSESDLGETFEDRPDLSREYERGKADLGLAILDKQMSLAGLDNPDVIPAAGILKFLGVNLAEQITSRSDVTTRESGPLGVIKFDAPRGKDDFARIAEQEKKGD